MGENRGHPGTTDTPVSTPKSADRELEIAERGWANAHRAWSREDHSDAIRSMKVGEDTMFAATAYIEYLKEALEGALARNDAEPFRLIGWGLFNPDTQRFRSKLYLRHDDAADDALRLTDNYMRIEARPLYEEAYQSRIPSRHQLIAAIKESIQGDFIGEDQAADAVLKLLSDGPLGGQDGIVQPSRDEHSTVLPTPPSKGGAET